MDYFGLTCIEIENEYLPHVRKEQRVNRFLSWYFLKVELFTHIFEYIVIDESNALNFVPFVVRTFAFLWLSSFVNPQLIYFLLVHNEVLATQYS